MGDNFIQNAIGRENIKIMMTVGYHYGGNGE
jgi:hypothetical protein